MLRVLRGETLNYKMVAMDDLESLSILGLFFGHVSAVLVVITIFGKSRDQNTKPYKLTQLTSFSLETNTNW